MKKIFFVLMMAASLVSTAQDYKPRPHLYVGGGVGAGFSKDNSGHIVALNTGIATRVVGIDVSMHAFPSPSSPAIFSGGLTKPFFFSNTKITIGGGYAYNLISNDDHSRNSHNFTYYAEVANLFTEGAAITMRASKSGEVFMFTLGIAGIFKKN